MKRKYPFIKQSGLKDCAAACTYMIIKYYNGFVGMNELSEMLKITRTGTTAYHIIKVLEELGFKAYGLKDKLENLSKHPCPFIVNVIINNSYKHFMVVYEVHKDYLLIADPSKKIYKIMVEDFKKIWTGVSLHMYPVKPIIKMKNESIKNFLKILVISNKKYLFIIFLLSLLVTIISIFLSFFLQIIFDNIHNDFIKQIFIFFFFLFISKIILEFLRNLVLIILNKKIDKYLTNKIFSKIIHLPYSYYHGKTTGEIISRIDDLTYVRNLFSNIALALFIDLPLSLITMVILIFLNVYLFIIVFIIFLLYILITFIFRNKLNYLVFKENYEKATVISYMTEAIRGFETIKGLGIENKITKKFQKKYEKQLNSSYKLNKFYNWLFLLKEFIDVTGQLLLVFLAIIFIQNNMMSSNFLLTYLILTSYFLMAIKTILNFDLEIKEAVEALKRIMDLTYYKDNKKYITKKTVSNIKIKNLNYSYDDINVILKNINLNISEGEKIFITGSSGSGKSTLLKIIMKFYKIKDNCIYFDNIDINKLSRQTINNNIVYIGQNEIFFTGPLIDNLKLRGNNYQKNVHINMLCDILKKDSLGYYMLLEENAFNLSGGQKQRLALARSMQKFKIILIDEGLSQVDVSMERQILKNIFHSYQDKTIIMVSHRLDNLDLFERYIKMHEGKIIIDEKRR